MARPSNNCDRRLIDAGIQLLAERSGLDFSVRDVCRTADVNLGMFTYHFSTRKNFERQVLDAASERLFAPPAAPIGLGEKFDPLDALVAALNDMLSRIRRERSLARAFFTEALKCQGKGDASEIACERLPRQVRLLQELIEDCQKAELIQPKIPAGEILTAIFGAVVMPMLWANAFISLTEVQQKSARTAGRSAKGMNAKANALQDEGERAAKMRLELLLEGMRPRSEGSGPIPAIRRLATRVGLLTDETGDGEGRKNPL